MLAFGAVPLFMLYVWGYCGVQYQMQHHAWTGATLWEAFLPFFALPVALVGVLLGLLIVSSLGVRSLTRKKENRMMISTDTCSANVVCAKPAILPAPWNLFSRAAISWRGPWIRGWTGKPATLHTACFGRRQSFWSVVDS